MKKKSVEEKVASKRYRPGRMLTIFDSLLGDAYVFGTKEHGLFAPDMEERVLPAIRDDFYAGVRRIVGSGDIRPVRAKPGKIAKSPWARCERVIEYLEALERKYGSLHEVGAREGRATAQGALERLKVLMGWSAQEKKPRGSKIKKSSDLPSPASNENCDEAASGLAMSPS